MAYDLGVPFLKVVGLYSPGVPNSERIIIRPNFKGSLAGHALAVGISAGDAGAIPLFDNIYWFQDIIVEPPAWIFVYTGKGSMRQTQLASGEPALVFHWQRAQTVFGHPDVVPILLQAASVSVVPKFADPHR